MKRLAAAAALLACACASASAQIAPLPRAACAGWQGERVCETLHEDAMIRVLRCTFPPTIGHEPHYHPPHFGYVLDGGDVRTRTEGEDYVTRAPRTDGTFTVDSELRHEALNIGAETMRYLIIEKKYADQRPESAVASGLCAAGAQ